MMMVVVVPVMAVSGVAGALAAHDLRLVGAFLIALMSNARIGIHVGEKGSARHARRGLSAFRALRRRGALAHSLPGPKGAAAIA